MPKGFPRHSKFVLVLRLYRFGKEGENRPITSTSGLSKASGVPYPSVKAWKDSGWLDLPKEVIRKIMEGKIDPLTLTQDDLKAYSLEQFAAKNEDEAKSEDGEDIEDDDDIIEDDDDDNESSEKSIDEDDFTDLLEGDDDLPFPIEKDKKAKAKKKEAEKPEKEKKDDTPLPPDALEFEKALLMTQEELNKNLPEKERGQGRSLPPRKVMITEFPASETVFHDSKYYERPIGEYNGEHHNEFLTRQVSRLRRVVDISSSQLESLVEEGRIGSKSAVAALTAVEKGLSLVVKYNKEIVDSSGPKETTEQRRTRLARTRDMVKEAQRRSEEEREKVKDDEQLARAGSRLQSFRNRQQEISASRTLEDIDNQEGE